MPILMSQRNFERLKTTLRNPAKPKRSHVRVRDKHSSATVPSLTEAAIVRQVRDFLEAEGWRLVRTGSGLVTTPDGRRYRHGEEGMADHLCIDTRQCRLPFWVETKRAKGGKLNPDQVEWQRAERAKGFTVVNVGHCTNAVCFSFDEFRVWYSDRLQEATR